MLLVLLLVSTITSIVGDPVNSAKEDIPLDNTPTKSYLSILIIGLPFPGHFIPCVSLADGLMLRGHSVTIASIDIYGLPFPRRTCVEKRIPHQLMNVSKEVASYDQFTNIAQGNSNFFIKMHRLGTLFKAFEDQFLDFIEKLDLSQFDIVISDDMILEAFCFAKMSNVRAVAISSQLVRDPHLLPPWPHPLQFYEFPSDMAFTQRVISTMSALVLATASKLKILSYAFTNQGQCWAGYQYWEAPGHHVPSLVTTAIGFELSRTRTPLTEYVGPLISPQQEPLPSELESWLGLQVEASIVYISMGSVQGLTPESARSFVEGIPEAYSVLWSLKNRDILGGIRVNESRFKIMSWIPQTTVLSHSSVVAAILHGGAGGMHQALYFGVPVIVTPITFDQGGNAARVQESGAGISLGLDQLTPELVHATIETLMSGSYGNEAKRVGRLLHEAGGVDRACDLIELYADVGYDHLVPAYAKYGWSWVAYSNIDVYCVSVLCLCAGGYATLRICQCCCCRCCCKRNKQKKD